MGSSALSATMAFSTALPLMGFANIYYKISIWSITSISREMLVPVESDEGPKEGISLMIKFVRELASPYLYERHIFKRERFIIIVSVIIGGPARNGINSVPFRMWRKFPRRHLL